MVDDAGAVAAATRGDHSWRFAAVISLAVCCVGLGLVFVVVDLGWAIRAALLAGALVLAVGALARAIALPISHHSPKWLRRIGVVAVGVVSAVVAMAAVVWAAQLQMLFPGVQSDGAPSASQGPGYSKVQFTSQDGVTYNGMMYQPSATPPGLVVYFGGNGQVSYDMFSPGRTADDWDQYAGYAVLYIDYPGYGLNQGQASQETIYAESLAVYDYAATLPGSSRIVAMGFSIGTGAAVYLAAHRPVDGLVLLAAYANGYDIYNNILPIFYGPGRLLVREKLPSDQYAPQVTCPVLMVASHADELVPFASSQRLSTRFAGPVSFFTLDYAGHNSIPLDPRTRDQMKAFLEGLAS